MFMVLHFTIFYISCENIYYSLPSFNLGLSYCKLLKTVFKIPLTDEVTVDASI